MKKLLLLTICILSSIVSYTQNFKDLIGAKWEIDEFKEFNGNKIFRRQGSNNENRLTNLSYQTCLQHGDELKKEAEDKMWDEQKKKDLFSANEELGKGGKLTLYIKRITIESANLKFFTIIIKDLEDKEVFRKELESRIANVPSTGSNLWSNLAIINIPKEIKGEKFTVYVIDALGGDNSKYKFEIIPVSK